MEETNTFILTTPDNVLKELGLTAAQDKKDDEPIFEPGAKLTTLSEDGAGGRRAGVGPEARRAHERE